MNDNKPVTPRCTLCKKLYSSKNDDGSGLCPKCRPAIKKEEANMNIQETQEIEVNPDNQVNQETQETQEEKVTQETQETQMNQEAQDTQEKTVIDMAVIDKSLAESQGDVIPEEEEKDTTEVDKLITPGKRGVTNFQMIPAMKKAIATESVEQLKILRKHYFYVFESSIRYLGKKQKAFIEANMK